LNSPSNTPPELNEQNREDKHGQCFYERIGLIKFDKVKKADPKLPLPH
jgi:hypothetical protein